ncbi:D-2-hydroxyacid dehydrogenase [Cyanobium sp. Alchichica 3B3-8F6]|uniref:D-2-hydroxyacid dehydrogenase n=1 Tax=Cyanobium sp. Alchichica 3B3-8F6 TaxID=2823696 RepID=UPI0020CDC7C9|nr:D-2-hydroxyacid dehydrogenase [Cyanobium sp. Alchichica 3B3-8F6]MCP9880884.1 D-2-hydroxyacid dehydrogenase [Cyanobium sp. Alchichica 3B3-8F6]
MQIVILDGYTANPGDLSWAELEALGPCTVFDHTEAEAVISRIGAAEIVLTNKTPLPADVLAALPHLKLISVLGTGFNVVDVAAAKDRGITVCNVPAYSTPGVAQAVFALLLELTNRTGHHNRTVHEGRWSASKQFCYWDGTLQELAGLTLGIVGYGEIGAAVARVGRAFGMHILANRRSGAGTIAEGGAFVDLDRLFGESDVVSLHCPLTADTAHLVNAIRLAQMKPTAYLINTARGGLVQEADLAAGFNAGHLAGAGLDVLSVEPPPADNPLLTAKNCVITPHIAWATRAARRRLLTLSAANIAAFLAGTPQHVVT